MNLPARPAKWEQFVWPVLTCAIFIAGWHYLVLWTDTKIFPSPQDVEKAIAGLIQGRILWSYIGDSLRRVAIGYGTASAIGVQLGLLLGWYPSAFRMVNPTLQLLRPISPIAWIPVAIIFFGVGDNSAIFLIFLGSFFPIVVAATGAVANVPLIFRRVGNNFGLTPARILFKVVFPAALPQMIVGLRIALGIAWLVVVAAEMIAVDSGLGYLVIDSRNSGKHYDTVVAAILLIGLIGLALDVLFRRLERMKSVRWKFRHAR